MKYWESIELGRKSRKKRYRLMKDLGYTEWVTFFPGSGDDWYISFVEVSTSDMPKPGINIEQTYMFKEKSNKSKLRMQLINGTDYVYEDFPY